MMGKEFQKLLSRVQRDLRVWAKKYIFGIFVFNLILMTLLLLYSAGYFHPFFQLSINLIFFIGIILSVFLLGANSRTLFVMGFAFWILVGFFRVFNIDIWAERTAIYAYQALVIGVVLLLVENIAKKRNA